MRWELLDRYLLHECSPAERAEVERWLAGSSARRELLEHLAKPEEPNPAASQADKGEVWARLLREIDPGGQQSGDDA